MKSSPRTAKADGERTAATMLPPPLSWPSAHAGLDRDQAPASVSLWGAYLMAMEGRAGRRIYRTKRWQAVRRAVFERDGWACVNCGRMGLIECDHIDPIRKQGDWFDMGNLQTLCQELSYRQERGGKPVAGSLPGPRPTNEARLWWQS